VELFTFLSRELCGWMDEHLTYHTFGLTAQLKRKELSGGESGCGGGHTSLTRKSTPWPPTLLQDLDRQED